MTSFVFAAAHLLFTTAAADEFDRRPHAIGIGFTIHGQELTHLNEAIDELSFSPGYDGEKIEEFGSMTGWCLTGGKKFREDLELVLTISSTSAQHEANSETRIDRLELKTRSFLLSLTRRNFVFTHGSLGPYCSVGLMSASLDHERYSMISGPRPPSACSALGPLFELGITMQYKLRDTLVLRPSAGFRIARLGDVDFDGETPSDLLREDLSLDFTGGVIRVEIVRSF